MSAGMASVWRSALGGDGTDQRATTAAARSPDRGRIELPEGVVVAYRPIRPADGPALRRFHHRLSPDSIYSRFFGHLPELSAARARYFTRLDGAARFALVALDPGRQGEIIGVVRFDRDPAEDCAEYAAIVEDRWQGRGLGTALTWRLIDAARARGLRQLYAIVLPDNRRMLRLLRGLGLPERIVWDDGCERIVITI